MSEIKNVGETWMAKYNQLTLMPFKGLITVDGLDSADLVKIPGLSTDSQHLPAIHSCLQVRLLSVVWLVIVSTLVWLFQSESFGSWGIKHAG